jgi:hypothetical protein
MCKNIAFKKVHFLYSDISELERICEEVVTVYVKALNQSFDWSD